MHDIVSYVFRHCIAYSHQIAPVEDFSWGPPYDDCFFNQANTYHNVSIHIVIFAVNNCSTSRINYLKVATIYSTRIAERSPCPAPDKIYSALGGPRSMDLVRQVHRSNPGPFGLRGVQLGPKRHQLARDGPGY
ncbi:hypothetical protein TESG_03104 [Trichophyton tonsurans CBS 112818]|uniref:Uncharacterized protein n=1 Tax=Trichophyton tonsurans (strain CBS 112818) TaxID=647933 RepID=F2RWG0_TRIT1|nr:hypothetical protein TESG_03104 [Trichophyton tonsurans CBS 112818]